MWKTDDLRLPVLFLPHELYFVLHLLSLRMKYCEILFAEHSCAIHATCVTFPFKVQYINTSL